MRKQLFLLALLGAAVPSVAQDKPAPAPAAPAAAKSKLEIINQGELRLDGKITALLGAGTWQVEALSWTSPRGVTTEFDEPKSKGVKVGADAFLHPRGEEDKVPLKDVKLGSRVAIIGKNGPDGTVIAREVVLLEGYGSRKTVGQVQTNRVTSMLVRQSREARDAGQLPKAMTLLDNAIATARGMGDSGGEALATQDKALLLLDMEQPEQAMNAFRRVQSLGRESNNALLMSLGMRGASGVLSSQGRLDEAIALLQEADPISANAEPEVHLGVVSSLAIAYLAQGQLEPGIGALERVHPLEQAQGKEADAGETLLLIAALQADEKPETARETLKSVQERIDRARDEKAKGALVGAAALVRWRLGEQEEAKAGFVQASQLLNAGGNAQGAKRWDTMAEGLQGAGDDWQSFWLVASGLNNKITKAEGEEGATPPGETPPAEEPPAENPPAE